MAIRKYLARDFTFAISTDNKSTWIPISGVSSWDWGIDNNEEDTSTFDNGAWGSAMYTQRTASMTLEGFYLVDGVTGARDGGQLLAEQAATKVGYEAYRDWRVNAQPLVSGTRGPIIGQMIFTGQAGLSEFGGSTTDVQPWGIDLIFEGAPSGAGIFDIFD